MKTILLICFICIAVASAHTDVSIASITAQKKLLCGGCRVQSFFFPAEEKWATCKKMCDLIDQVTDPSSFECQKCHQDCSLLPIGEKRDKCNVACTVTCEIVIEIRDQFATTDLSPQCLLCHQICKVKSVAFSEVLSPCQNTCNTTLCASISK
jgi:hypothetical protein